MYALIRIDLDLYFLQHLCMNLLLLNLNCISLWGSSVRTATRRRVWLGAVMGAVCSWVSIWIPGTFAMRQIIGGMVSFYTMAGICFGKWWGRGILTHLKNMICYGFLLGGAMVFLLKTGLPARILSAGISNHKLWIFLLTALAAYDLLLLLNRRGKRDPNLCRAILVRGDGSHLTVSALMDTGNSLKEPISGRPVAVTCIDLMSQYFKGSFPQGFRAVPYHSVGCNGGIMKGYRIPEMILETDGICYKIRDVYAAVSDNKLTRKGRYEMIVSPDFLKDN